MKRIKPFISFIKEQEDNEEDKEYTFEELSPEAKINALDEMRDINVEYTEWHQPVVEGFEEEMKELGLEEVEVQYSGFYSQGDGASFTGEVYDSKTFMSKALDLKDTEWLDMGEEEKPEDEDSRLRADLLDIGFDTREKLTPDNFRIAIDRISSRYAHENTIEGRVDIDDIPESIEDEVPTEAIVGEIEEKVTDWARSEAKTLYRNLERYFDELTSDEIVEETIIESDYRFNKDGKLV